MLRNVGKTSGESTALIGMTLGLSIRMLGNSYDTH